MTRWNFLAVGCCFLFAVSGSIVHAQSPTAPVSPAATLVAVVDIPKVFETHPNLKAGLESMQQQLKGIEADLEAKQKSIAQQGRQLADLDPASDDYRKLEADLARRGADLQVEARQTKKEFLQREAQHYYSSYNDILQATDHVAQRHGIGLVLRFDSRDINPDDPQSVVQGMNRAVVLQHNLDITQMVVEELQRILLARSPGRAPRR